MRLYDSKSCTPAGGVTWKPWKSCPSKAFGPSWSLGVQHTPRPMTSTLTSDARNDENNFPDDEMSSLMPTGSSRPLHRRSSSVPRNRSFGVSLSFHKTSRQRPSNDSQKTTVERHGLWPPSKSRVPFTLVQNKAVDAEGTTWAPSCHCDKKHDRCETIPPRRTTSRNVTATDNSTLGCEFSPTESTSDDSSSGWLDFSLDGNENPFHKTSRTTSASFRFVPIERAPEQRSVMMIKPTPVHRTKSSHTLFPSQDSRESVRFIEYNGNTRSAFSTPNRSLSSGRLPVSRLTMDSTPRLAPSKRDVESITGSPLRRVKGHSEAKMLVDLAKYSSMLKSRVPLVLVKKIMEREGVSSSIIELAMAAHNAGIEFGDGVFF